MKTNTPLLIVVVLCGSAAAFLGGRWLFAARTESATEPVEMVAGEKENSVAPMPERVELPKGKIKFYLRASNGFQVRPGDRVTVLLTETSTDGQAVTRVVQKDLLVLFSTPGPWSRGKPATFKMVAVAMTEDETSALAQAEKRGEVHLAGC